MKLKLGVLFQPTIIVLSIFAGGFVGSLEGSILDIIASAILLAFVAWVTIHQPTALLIIIPSSAALGFLFGSWVACVNGAFLGVLLYWLITAPKTSILRKFSSGYFDELLNEGASKPILLFVIAFPFVIVSMVIIGGIGYLIAGDIGIGVGAVIGILIGVFVSLRKFESIHPKLTTWQLSILIIVIVAISLMYESIRGGLAMAIYLYFVIGVGLILWNRRKR